MNNLTLYLASASPRRRELLEKLGLDFTVLPQDIDESPLANEPAEAYVMRLASSKAEAALASLSQPGQAVCLGSDTTVVCDDMIFEKPADQADARRILGILSGRSHQVHTAVAVATADGIRVVVSTSTVTFRDISEVEMDAYWSTGEPQDKAGAYAVQGLGAMFVTHISGSYSGIMGLPVFETVSLLTGAGLSPQQILEEYAKQRL